MNDYYVTKSTIRGQQILKERMSFGEACKFITLQVCQMKTASDRYFENAFSLALSYKVFHERADDCVFQVSFHD